MSLHLILPPEGVQSLLTEWPDEPRVYRRKSTDLDRAVSAAVLHDHVATGCLPADELAVVRAPYPSLNQNAFKDNGRTNAVKLRELYDQGFTIRIGNLQRIMPFMAHASRTIQQETGYGNHVTAFLTPPGSQGLRHHWDQQMGVIVQLEGVKRWHLWRPPVEAPMREYNESWRVWKASYVEQWESAGPDLEIDLRPGESLLLPRGWVHNPHVPASDSPSVHLTFVLCERTPLWLAEQLIAGAIEDPDFRRVLLPSQVTGTGLTNLVEETRTALLTHLENLVPEALTATVQKAALAETEHRT
ncbi:cupin [Streptomyces sp. AJS327]|uniref:JmjC domain-containing protein n=1 Tax=Streptomyces sp. AJS327 TaxID=2545265 RepID=UPI0015DF9FDF|nr:cupin domain-containing protein [Streptomyces sp. AJS327]MBA0053023.1 cupin [Streptomyces sp. AJS327]